MDQPTERVDMSQETWDDEDLIKLGGLSSLPLDADSSACSRSDRLLEQSALRGLASGMVGQDSSAKRRSLTGGRPSSDLLSDEIVVLREPMSPRAADIRRLAQKLAVHWFRGQETRTALSVISAERDEGRTTIATNLACVYAQAGVRTLLIDADLYNPSVHALFGLDVSDYDERGFLRLYCVDNLSIISAARSFDVEHGKIMPSALSELIDRQASEFDVILVDTTAASVSDDYLFAAISTQGAIVATSEGKTKVKAAARMLNSCEDAGVKIVGGIMLKS